MKKFHLVSECILLLLILAVGYRAFTVDNKDSSQETSDFAEQMTALEKKMQVLAENQKRQEDYFKKELRDLGSDIQAWSLVDKLNAVWNSDSSREVTDDSRNIDLAEEILKNPEFTKIVKQEVDKIVAGIRENSEDPEVTKSLRQEMDKLVAEIGENSEDSEFTKSLKQEVIRIVAGIRKKEREGRQQRYTELRNAALQRRIDGYAKELNLNDSQKEELAKIAQDGLKKMQDVVSNFRDGELNQEQMRTEMDNVYQDIDEEVQQVLSPDQYEQYKKETGGLFK